MSRPIYVTIGVLVLLICGLFLFRGTEPVLPVEVSDAGEMLVYGQRDTLHTRQKYYLRVPFQDSVASSGVLTWAFTKEGDVGEKEWVKGNSIPPFNVPRAGTYLVQAFLDQGEVARDTFVVVEGDRIDVTWPPAQIAAETTITAMDRSAGAKRRSWSVLEGDQLHEAGSGEQFQYTPMKPGALKISLALQMSARDTVLEYLVQVTKPLPKYAVDKVEKKKEQPISEPKPPPGPRPSPSPEPTPNVVVEKGDCFAKGASLRGAPEVLLPIPVPDYAAVVWGGSTETIMLVTSERDCQLTSLQCWANPVEAADATVVVECLAPQCKGLRERKWDFPFKGDAYKPNLKVFSNSPVLRAGLPYRIRVKTPPGMGMVDLPTTAYEQAGIRLNFPQGKSSVFQLSFRAR